MGLLYLCPTLVHQYGGQKLSARRKKDFATKVMHCMRTLRTALVIIFNLLALSEKHFKSADMLVSIIFEIMLIESRCLQFVIWKTKHSSGTKVSPDV